MPAATPDTTANGNSNGTWEAIEGGGEARSPPSPAYAPPSILPAPFPSVGEKCCKNPGSWNPWESFGSEASDAK